MKDSACNVNCGGEPSVTCGGTFEMEVYRIGLYFCRPSMKLLLYSMRGMMR